MQSVRIYFDDENEKDGELVAAIAAMPKGERSTRLKALIALALAGTSGLLVRVEALERRVTALEGLSAGSPVPPMSASPSKPTVAAQKAALGLLKQFGAFDD